MRSGPYSLAGVVLHHGSRVQSGHYTAVCWLGGERYAEFNDDVVSPKLWSYLESPRVQAKAYMLVYVREAYWDDTVGDGDERVPYARDPQSDALARKSFRGFPVVGGARAATDTPAEVSAPGGTNGAEVDLPGEAMVAAAVTEPEQLPITLGESAGDTANERQADRKRTAAAALLSIGDVEYPLADRGVSGH